MTPEEALKVAQIACTADNGCPYCAANLAERLMAALPEVDWKAAFKTADPNIDDLKPYTGDWRSV